jgi:hypothetical protein
MAVILTVALIRLIQWRTHTAEHVMRATAHDRRAPTLMGLTPIEVCRLSFAILQ